MAFSCVNKDSKIGKTIKVETSDKHFFYTPMSKKWDTLSFYPDTIDNIYYIDLPIFSFKNDSVLEFIKSVSSFENDSILCCIENTELLRGQYRWIIEDEILEVSYHKLFFDRSIKFSDTLYFKNTNSFLFKNTLFTVENKLNRESFRRIKERRLNLRN